MIMRARNPKCQIKMEEMQETQTEEKATRQECRAELRERFLWAITSLVGKEATINMHEKTRASGIFRGIDKDILSMQIQDLKTPCIVYPRAMIRVPDCMTLHFKL